MQKDQINILICVFSYNRAPYLENCLISIYEMTSNRYPVYVFDDDSDDSATLSVLEKFRSCFHIITTSSRSSEKTRHGGLYNSMSLALSESINIGAQYALFIQDDMQLVRPIQNLDMSKVHKFFQYNQNCVQLQAAFLKGRHRCRHDNKFSGDPTRFALFPQFSGDKTELNFSDVGIFHTLRVRQVLGDFSGSEIENARKAKTAGLEIGYSVQPFMMWLPLPVSYRSKSRSVIKKLCEKISKSDVYPIKYLGNEIQNDPKWTEATPKYAEDWLCVPGLPICKYWGFGGLANLLAFNDWRQRIGRIGMRTMRLIKYLKNKNR